MPPALSAAGLSTMFTSIYAGHALYALYPTLISQAEIQDIFVQVRSQITQLGQSVLSFSLAHAVNVFTIAEIFFSIVQYRFVYWFKK